MDQVPRQKVRSSSRTKALLHSLPLDTDFSIGIEANDGANRVSPVATVAFDRAVLESLAAAKKPPAAPHPPPPIRFSAVDEETRL